MEIFLLAIVPFLLTVIITPILIPFLRKAKFGQSILQIGPAWHNKKQGTPTMGGIAFILSIIISSIAYYFYSPSFAPSARSGFVMSPASLFAPLLVALAFGLIGFLDDYLKVVKKQNLGLKAWQKFGLQVLVSLIYAIYFTTTYNSEIIIPFIGEINLYPFFVPYCIFILVGVSNAVNLTDGVDGLVSTLIPISFAALFIINGFFPMMPLIIISAVLGFLVYNRNPAKIFMGDTGSLFLGGFLAVYAIQNPIALLLVGVIYFAETLSVILQVAFFKLTGRRIFKMSPLHHHFEMSGWNEKKIVRIFSLVTIFFSAIAYMLYYIGW